MAVWTGYYIQINGLSDLADARNTTQNSVSLVGPYTADDGSVDGTASIDGSDVTESFVFSSSMAFTIGGVDYAAETGAFGWELANGDMVFSLDFSGTESQGIVDALNASGGVIDSVSFGYVGSNSLATPQEDYSLSTTRYGGPACFAKGTEISTPSGSVPIEELSRGDLVNTLDSGPLPIKWLGQSQLIFTEKNDRQKPILFPKECLGANTPQSDIILSPQHRILLKVETSQFLVPARFLIGHRRIRVMRGKKSITFFHLMLESHQLLLSHNCASESFYPGPIAIAMIGDQNRKDIAKAFGMSMERLVRGYGPHVRPVWPRNRSHEIARALKRALACKKPTPALSA